MPNETIEGHGGTLAVAAARVHGVETMFTLSGAHVFPLYDAAVKPEPTLRLVDVRHEPTAVFAAEATGKLTRVPGLAVLTAGPGVTNGVSPITQAKFAGSPLVVLGGRSPQSRWGTGALQELDHVPILAPVCKLAETVFDVAAISARVDAAFAAARSSHRGPTFLDVPMDQLFQWATAAAPGAWRPTPEEPDADALQRIAGLLATAARPVLVLGTDVWADGAEAQALAFVEATGIPTITNGMARGVIPGGHPLLMTKARSAAFKQADLVIVVGTPLDFRLGYGVFGEAAVVHIADSAAQVSAHANPAASVHGDLGSVFTALLETSVPDWSAWATTLQEIVAAGAQRDAAALSADADPIHPARIYGELNRRLADDAVVIGDGGDFVSFAGKYVEPRTPGNWLDPGPYGCLGAGLGAAIAARIARPAAQVVALLGDGAAGMSLMDVDTLVRHNLPAVLVVGNNSCWGLEKTPMQTMYGYDVAADLGHETSYDAIVRALGGAGETVTRPGDIGPALDRAFASNVPYLVNVITDQKAAYPRTTLGV